MLDIQFADIETCLPKNGKKVRRHAKGRIAVGDTATGVIAIGFVARWIVAVGSSRWDRRGGIVAVGSLSIGLFSIGGVALCLMSLGGLAAGAFSVGGGAFAHDLAFGGFAVAEESNTPVAKRVAEAETMLAELMWLSKHQWILFFITAGAIVLQIIVTRRLYTVVLE
ncbi:MAG: hypothetical protein OSA98_11735 [Rubripirellula sp.]|nr:hypothetical protein [Rubripirellula sp.]